MMRNSPLTWVGVAGFEPAASSSRTKRAAKLRHTAASWLVMDGVPLYDVQALLGHESFATTQRYAHLAPDAHSRVIAAWSRRRDASATHGASLGGAG